MFPLFFFWKALFPAVSFVAHNSQLNTFQSNFSRYFRLFTTSLQNELSKAFHTTRLFALNGFIVQRQFSEKTASGTISETSVDLSIDCQRRRRRICQLHAYSRRNRTKRKLCHPITTDSLCTACWWTCIRRPTCDHWWGLLGIQWRCAASWRCHVGITYVLRPMPSKFLAAARHVHNIDYKCWFLQYSNPLCKINCNIINGKDSKW